MEDRTLDVNVVSARGLKDVNLMSKMRVYVEVSLAGDVTSEQKSTTTVDEVGRRDPNWNFMMKFTVNETSTRLYRQYLVFSLRTKRTVGERDIGKVTVPVNELLVAADDKLMKYVTYQVRNPSGKHCGDLNFSYKFNDRNGRFVQSPAVNAYYGGPHHSFHPDVYPPPPKPHIQFPPPPSSAPYGVYQPPLPSYGYPPQGRY